MDLNIRVPRYLYLTISKILEFSAQRFSDSSTDCGRSILSNDRGDRGPSRVEMPQCLHLRNQQWRASSTSPRPPSSRDRWPSARADRRIRRVSLATDALQLTPSFWDRWALARTRCRSGAPHPHSRPLHACRLPATAACPPPACRHPPAVTRLPATRLPATRLASNVLSAR